MHLGSGAFQNALEAILNRISNWDSMRVNYEDEIAELGVYVQDEDAGKASKRRRLQLKLSEAEISKKTLSKLYQDVTYNWSAESRRILGHVLYSPPISIRRGDTMFTEDWAVVEVQCERFNWETFRGNVIHLGYELAQHRLMEKVYPHVESRVKFKYPHNGLMELRDFVKRSELFNPTMLDENGEECLIVVKNGAATGFQLSRATGIESFVREYKNYNIYSTSRDVAVYSYNAQDKAFSAHGDSGSVVADVNGRIVGILTGGTTSQTESTDVTYVTPYHSLDECIKNIFPNSYLYPTRKSKC